MPPTPSPLFEVQDVVDALGRSGRYRLSHPPKPAPLLLMVQGSGCTPVVDELRDGRVFSSIFNLSAIGADGRFAVLAVTNRMPT